MLIEIYLKTLIYRPYGTSLVDYVITSTDITSLTGLKNIPTGRPRRDVISVGIISFFEYLYPVGIIYLISSNGLILKCLC